MKWNDPEAMNWLLDLKARLGAGDEPTDEDKHEFEEMLESIRPVLEAFQKIFVDLVDSLVLWWRDFWDGLDPATQEALMALAAKPEHHHHISHGVCAFADCPNPEEAVRIAKSLVSERFAPIILNGVDQVNESPLVQGMRMASQEELLRRQERLS